MASRYSISDTSSPYQRELESSKLPIPRSLVDDSHNVAGQALFGELKPIWWTPTVPNEEININLNALIELRNPTNRRLLNGCRVFFRAQWHDMTDLWEGAKNFIDKGRSGEIGLELPHVIWKATNTEGYSVNACSPLSLMNDMGIPARGVQTRANSEGDFIPTSSLRWFQPILIQSDEASIINVNNDTDYIDALPFMAYQRDWRDNFCNKNLLQSNKFWFPDNEDHFILSYNASGCAAINYEEEDFGEDADLLFENISGVAYNKTPVDVLDSGITPEPNNPSTSTPEMTNRSLLKPNLVGKKFVQFRGDRFTTSSPFPELIRGEIPNIKLNNEDIVNFVNQAGTRIPVDGSSTRDDPKQAMNFAYSGTIESGLHATIWLGDSVSNGSLKVNSSSIITQSDLEALKVATVFKQRMARTSGEYNDMIEAQFGYNPRLHDRRSRYVGSCYQDIVFSSVTSTVGTDDAPLGSKAGQGISSSSGRIGKFTSTNYGYLLVYMYIVPDVYYTQGIDRKFFRKNQLDFYFPIFNNLAPQAILNKELYVSGDPSVDDMPFSYEPRYEDMKSSRNIVTGLSALPPDTAEFDAAQIMARRFTSTPKFNNNFVSLLPENTDMNVFSVNDEPPFDFSVGINCTRVGPYPYVAVEGAMNIHA